MSTLSQKCARAGASTALIAWMLVAPGVAQASAAAAGALAKAPAAATVEQCLTIGEQAERSATFVGEMTAIPGTARMEMRISVLERTPGEFAFHYVASPGLGVWRAAAAGVRDYRYLKQVTDLSAPAVYRALVRFRWLNDRGRAIHSTELLTPRCRQPGAPGDEEPPAASSAPGSSSAPGADTGMSAAGPLPGDASPLE